MPATVYSFEDLTSRKRARWSRPADPHDHNHFVCQLERLLQRLSDLHLRISLARLPLGEHAPAAARLGETIVGKPSGSLRARGHDAGRQRRGGFPRPARRRQRGGRRRDDGAHIVAFRAGVAGGRRPSRPVERLDRGSLLVGRDFRRAVARSRIGGRVPQRNGDERSRIARKAPAGLVRRAGGAARSKLAHRRSRSRKPLA